MSASASTHLRVRQILDGISGASRAALLCLLPDEALTPPDVETARYPNALLQFLPKESQYSYLGLIAEDMLRLETDSIHFEQLKTHMLKYHPDAKPDEILKVEKSKTTQPFLDLLITTREKLDDIVTDELEYDSVLIYNNVMGHPDIMTDDKIFEVKLTGELKKNWNYFMLQLFSYSSLCPDADDIYLILPLQTTICHFKVNEWKNKTKFRESLIKYATKLIESFKPVTTLEDIMASLTSMMSSASHVDTYNIGCHYKKEKTLLKTIQSLPDTEKPYQIFLGGPVNSNMTAKDDDLAATSAQLAKTGQQIFIHSQYIINLANNEKDSWATKLLAKNLQYGAAMGSKGVVVHVGKSKDTPYKDALAVMRANIESVLESVDSDCPLLLETPAGQGSEMLKGMDEFIEFVASFESEKLRICVDTCHVFACGHDPLTYINRVVEKDRDLLRLVHYNDSMDVCGSCKDRHAVYGTGKIGMPKMEAIAKRCSELNVSMVIE